MLATVDEVTELWAGGWDRVTAVQQPPSDVVLLLCAAAALAAVGLRPVWALVGHVSTIAHEGAHGVAALLTGRRLSGIRLHRDTSGLTVSRGRPSGPGMLATLLAGYLGPSAVGLAAAALLGAGYAVGVLWALLATLALLLLQIRNLFGLWSVLVTGAALVAVTTWLAETGQSAVAHVVALAMLLAGPRDVLGLARSRRRRGGRSSDADQLGRLTRTPGGLWVAVFAVATLAALALGGSWLLGDPLARLLGT